jgi:hypothetical protein
MYLTRHLRPLTLALGLMLATGAALAGTAALNPAEAWDNRGYRNHPIYNDRQAWFMVDRDQNGRISSKEWKWAEKNGYDRLNGVPKRHLTRNEYQRYLEAYLVRRDAYNNRDWRDDDHDHGRDYGEYNERDQRWIYRTNKSDDRRD